MKGNIPVDKNLSLSMMMALGMVLASGARAEARARRERRCLDRGRPCGNAEIAGTVAGSQRSSES